MVSLFFSRVKGRPWCSTPQTPVRPTASSPSGWKNTRPTFIRKVRNVSCVQAHPFLGYSWLLFFISRASGASHSGTTPDQDCSIFASLTVHDPPLLFDLEADPSEHYPLSLDNRPDLQAVLGRIRKVKEQFEGSMVFGESQISKGIDPSLEPCCSPQCGPKPSCCHCWREASENGPHSKFYGDSLLFIMKGNTISVLSEEMRLSHTDSTNAWCDFHSLLEDWCIFHLNTMSYPNIGIWKRSCRCEPDNNKDFRHQAYILFIRPNPWQGSVIVFFIIFFPGILSPCF